MNNISSRLATLIVILSSTVTFAHTRLVFPTPRNNNAGIKTGPCGGFSRSTDPTIVQAGQTITVSWEETVNHPGKFLFALSMGNDAGFQSNPLGTMIDTQNDGQTLHSYNMALTMPNVACDTCTIQLIQSMEENPNAPTYYYSCADVKIVANNVPINPGPDNPVSGQGVSTSKATAPSMAGCGLVKSEDLPPPPMKMVGVLALLLLLPFIMITQLRRRAQPVRVRTNQRFRRY